MTDLLLQSYFPLFLWTGMGLFLMRLLPVSLPRFLGRSLYWVGVPLEILALARQTDFSAQVGLAPLLTIGTLITGLLIAWLTLQVLFPIPVPHQEDVALPPLSGLLSEPVSESIGDPLSDPTRRGSFLIASVLGNTGFVGLAIAPSFVAPEYLGWLICYSVTQNVIGTYGMGVFIASYYGRKSTHSVWAQIRDVLSVPSLWAFTLGFLTRSAPLPEVFEAGLTASVWIVIPAALLLMGMRLRQLQGWKSLRLALIPTLIKTIALPGLLGLVTLLIGLPADARLALVLMAGMPSAFAGLILAEEYEIDRTLIASSILLTTIMSLVIIPVWLALL
jgi:hypothetical protein